MSERKPHLLFVVGPTGCGKSDLGVEIAESFGPPEPQPEIINSDSVAFFELVQIGAAKPGPVLLARARHHLVGHVLRNEKYTAGDFRRDALRVLETRASQSTKFLVVGGSGFYSQALEKGMYDVAEPSAELKAQLAKDAETLGMGALHAELIKRDPESGARISPADHYRTLRALEILRGDERGLVLSEIKAEFERAKPPSPFTCAKIGLFRPRDVLRQKITERTQKMIKEGLIEEVQFLRAEGLQNWSPLQSVGYKEVQAMLDGELRNDELESAIVTSTMQLAKQQMTWFKRDPSTRWFDTDTAWKEAVTAGRELLTLDVSSYQNPDMREHS